MDKKRTLAGFDQVAKNINIDKDNDIDTNKLDEEQKARMQQLHEEVKRENLPKDETHIFRGYYLEKELVDAIEKFTEGQGRGYKSDLINKILKSFFLNDDK